MYSLGNTAKIIIKPYNEDGWSLSYDWVEDRMCLLSCRLNQLPAAKARFVSNLLDVQDQMHYDNLPSGTKKTPFFVKFLIQANVVNLWFATLFLIKVKKQQQIKHGAQISPGTLRCL